jgi:hypothetical protein
VVDAAGPIDGSSRPEGRRDHAALADLKVGTTKGCARPYVRSADLQVGRDPDLQVGRDPDLQVGP